MVIVLSTIDLQKLELSTNIPNYMIEELFVVKIKPLSRKRKSLKLAEISTRQGNKKKVMMEPLKKISW